MNLIINSWRRWRARVWDRKVFKLEATLAAFVTYPHQIDNTSIRDHADNLRNRIARAKYQRTLYNELLTPTSIPKAQAKETA